MHDPALSESQLLKSLQPGEIDAILSASTKRRFVAKAVIAHQGALGNCLYLLLDGCARAYVETPDGKSIFLASFTRGVLSLSAVCIEQKPNTVSIQAVSECTVLCWNRATIHSLGRRYPALLFNMLQIASEYLELYADTYRMLTSRSASGRLAHAISQLATKFGYANSDGIEIAVTNEELAFKANITPFTASRLLSTLQKRGILTKRRHKIIVHKPEKLVPRALAR